MSSTAGLTEKMLYARGQLWFAFLGGATPEAKTAISRLDPRGYGAAGAKQGQTPTEAQRGLALLQTFGASLAVKTQARTNRSVGKDALEKAEKELRHWLRGRHKEVGGIRREELLPALLTLPALGELTREAGLASSARAFLAFLEVSAVQTALNPYHMGPADVTEGKALLEAFETQRGKVAGARGTEGTAKQQKRAAREAFDGWLNKWWAIASTRLADQPQILTVMGVESRRWTSTKAKDVGAV